MPFKSTNTLQFILQPHTESREVNQARTATAGNKEPNFWVKKKPQITLITDCIFEAYFMIKTFLKSILSD